MSILWRQGVGRVDYALMGGRDLSEAEQRVRDAFPSRELVDLRVGDPVADDPASAASWTDDRVVRGETIAALLLGAVPAEPGRVAAVRLAGARITGVIDVREGDAGAMLELTGCSLDCPPAFDEATCKAIRMAGCVLPGFTGLVLAVRGAVRFVDCAISGPVMLRNARIEGTLHLSGSRFSCAGRQALSAGGITVESGVYARDLRVEGVVRLIGGRFRGGIFLEGARLANPDGDTITGDGITASQVDLSGSTHEGTLSLRGARVSSLSLEGATLGRPGGYALHADHLDVTTYLNASGVTADGEVCVNDAHVGSIFSLDGARLRNPAGASLTAVGIHAEAGMSCCDGFDSAGEIQLHHARIGHLSFRQATLSNVAGAALRAGQLQARELILRTAHPAAGIIDLRDARIGSLHDDPAGWPDTLRLEGLSYDTLDPALTARQRLGWLNRDSSGPNPRAYEQLSGMYRRLGSGDQARAVQLARQRERRRTLSAIPRAWGYLQDWTVGYGYLPARAAVGLLLLWAIGTSLFSLHHPVPAAGADPRTFEPAIFTLGLLLPVIDFQEESIFTPQGAQAWLAFALIAAGWILVTTVTASIVRALRGESE